MAAGGMLLVILVLTSVNAMLAEAPNSARHGKTENDFVLHILVKQREFLCSFKVVNYWYGISVQEEHYIVVVGCSCECNS